MTTRSTTDIEPTLREAADSLEELGTADDVRGWWRRYYIALGHKRLGRLLLGQSAERLLERSRIPIGE